MRPSPPRSYPVVVALALLLVLARSAVFVFWEGSHFDANQAVFGLMAKHLAELRAVPIFMYGQNYMLALESWLAAPLFALAGPTVTALKLPMLAMNLAIAWLLVRAFVRDGGLGPWAAGVAAIFFLLPGPGTTARLTEASGGTLEPLLYVMLFWTLRRRPAWLGLVIGVGIVHREFTLYGLAALLLVEGVRGRILNADGLRRWAVTLAVAALPYAAAQAARPYSPAAGPGTTPADLGRGADDVLELAERFCIDLPAVPNGYLDIARVHWPLLFATEVRPVRQYDIESDVVQGAPWVGAVLGLAMLIGFARVAATLGLERRWRTEYDVYAYLLLTACASISAYVLFRCGVIVPVKMRYDMLSVLGACGLAGWFLLLEGRAWLRAAWGVLILAWVAAVARPHAELLAQYVSDPPVGGKRVLVRALQARGIRYASASYALAYPIAFLSNEEILVESSNRMRILAYRRAYLEHRAEAVRIQRTPCQGGSKAMSGVYLCPATAGQGQRQRQY